MKKSALQVLFGSLGRSVGRRSVRNVLGVLGSKEEDAEEGGDGEANPRENVAGGLLGGSSGHLGRTKDWGEAGIGSGYVGHGQELAPHDGRENQRGID